MSTAPLSRRLVIAAGGAALVAMSALTACSPTKEKEAPSSTTTAPSSSTASSSAAPSPTEKAISPAGPSFSPTVNPAPPGAVCNKVDGTICQR